MTTRMSIVTSALLILATGCATIITGTSQSLTFGSNPAGADILVDGIAVGTTPLTVRVKKRAGTRVTVRKTGFRDQHFVLQHAFQPWFFGNFIIGGLLGSTTDVASGATIEYSPEQFYTTLEPVEGAALETTMRATETPQNRVIRFILVNYAQLAEELNVGSGEHLDALLHLLGNEGVLDRAATVDRIKALYVEGANAPQFAESVAKEFEVNRPTDTESPEVVVETSEDSSPSNSTGGATSPSRRDEPQLGIAASLEDNPDNGASIMGNGDGIVQKGESFDLVVSVTNRGQAMVKELECEMSLDAASGIKTFSDHSQVASNLVPGTVAIFRYSLASPLDAEMVDAPTILIRVESQENGKSHKYNYRVPVGAP